jgi:hypothetical protein
MRSTMATSSAMKVDRAAPAGETPADLAGGRPSTSGRLVAAQEVERRGRLHGFGDLVRDGVRLVGRVEGAPASAQVNSRF